MKKLIAKIVALRAEGFTYREVEQQLNLPTHVAYFIMKKVRRGTKMS